MLILVVVAEYLAKGYKLSDQILERAIDMDSTCFDSFSHSIGVEHRSR